MAQKGKKDAVWRWSKAWLDFKAKDSPFVLIKEFVNFQSNDTLAFQDLRVIRGSDHICAHVLRASDAKVDGRSLRYKGGAAAAAVESESESESESEDEGSEAGIVSDDDSFGRHVLANVTAGDISRLLRGNGQPETLTNNLCLCDDECE